MADNSRDELLREYAEHVQALDQMEASPGWQVFIDRLRHDSQMHRNSVLSGNLEQERYRYECGWLAGALAAVDVPQKVRDEYKVLLDQADEPPEE